MEDIHTLRRNCSGLGHEWALLTGVGKGRSQWLWVGGVGGPRGHGRPREGVDAYG